MARRGKKGRLASNKTEHVLVESLDELAEFREYRSNILKKFQTMLKKGKSSEEILKLAQKIAAARLGTIAATEVDSSRALAAIKDLLDRTQGRAVETKKVEHKFEKLSDDDLDAVIASQMDKLVAEEEEEEDQATH